MLGILVHGANHFIVKGPLPSPECARALARFWEIPQLGAPRDARFSRWHIIKKAFREDLEWAVELEGDLATQENVRALLDEVKGRGIAVLRAPGPLLPLVNFSAWKGECC